MKYRTVLLSVVILLLLSTGVAVAITQLSLERTNPMSVSSATSTSQPFLEIDLNQEIPSGTNNVELAILYNNYDETQNITLDVSNSSEITFTDGTNTNTYSVAPNSSATVYVDTSGPTKTCAETTSRVTQSMSYQADSSTYTVSQTQKIVEVCQPGGGSDPPPGDPSNAEVTLDYNGQTGQNYEFSWSTNISFDGSAEFYTDGSLVEGGLPITETKYKTKDATSGGTAEVIIYDSNGNQVASDTINIP